MLTAAQFDDAKTRPEISTYLETTYTITDEAIQSNYTNPYHPDCRSPTNDVHFRKAFFYLVDKDWIVESVYRGLAERIDVVVAAPSRAWMNESEIGDNYPFKYSVANAIAELNAGGWNDTDDADTTLNYPEGWPGRPGRPNMDPIEYWIYNDPPQRYEYAHHIAEELRALGIPVTEHIAPFTLVNDQCFCAYKFHITSDGWSVGRFPTYQEFFFHSDYWIPGYCGSNCYTGAKIPENPWQEEIDAAVAAVRYATTPEESMLASKHAQYLLNRKWALGMIPILSGKGFYATRDLLGMVKFFGGAPFNWASEMNMYRLSDPNAPVRMAITFPSNVNTLYCMWAVGYTIMQRIWEGNLELNPIDPMYEMPQAALDWDVGTWSGGSKSLVKWWWKPGIHYIEPGTGNELEAFTGASQVFGWWYVYQTPDAWWWSDFKDIHHIRISPTDPNYMECYWDTLSCFSYLDAPGSTNLGIYPPAYKVYPIVEDPDNPGTAGPAHKVFVEGVDITTPGDLPLPFQAKFAPVEVVSIVSNVSGTLTPSSTAGDNDYEIVKGKIHIYKDCAPNEKLTVTYWARGKASGTLVGDKSWNEVFIGAGMWYMTSFDILTAVNYKANRHYHWTTPPLGETDWYWWRIEGPKPRGGYMQINIYDVVVATGAYGTSGRYIPDLGYTPTADLAPSADGLPCKIDIYDVVTITANYGKKFWVLP
jgi:hypothetical protein